MALGLNRVAGDRLRGRVLLAVPLLIALIGCAGAQPTAAPVVQYADQGWSDADRNTFYTTSQGSRMMPYAWFKALRRLDIDAPFGADQLERYGYIRNDSPANVAGLPVGFVIAGSAATGQLGMSCAACHTGQLEYQQAGVTYALRLDGAPTNADFQQFLTDLATASRATLAQPDRFDAFAKAVLGAGLTAGKMAQLKIDFAAWVKQFSDFMDVSLPPSPWGPGRLDAFGMIFNRLAAHDLGVAANFKVADAPVSYPFLWNALRQDKTQWTGGVPSGLYIEGLARNTGEVFGVFADLRPKSAGKWIKPTQVVFKDNSADFDGMEKLEEKLSLLRPPSWPRAAFGLDDDLAAKGKVLFKANCDGCHAQRMSPHLPQAWDTPVRAVGTDPKMALNSQRMSDPGPYAGALLPAPEIGVFKNPAATNDMLAFTVVGSLLDAAVVPPVDLQGGVWRAIRMDLATLLPGRDGGDTLRLSSDLVHDVHGMLNQRLANMYSKPATADPGVAYESRVLRGIWATAPYLHNGSVPNLWELLTPPKQRKTTFMVGSRLFDPKNVGYATDHSPFKNAGFVTDPDNANGNGNGGHDYGTSLTDAERWAIIEYMKTPMTDGEPGGG